MDTEIVRVIERGWKTPDMRAAATKPGTRIGKLTVVKRNALGNVVLKCDCGETIRLSPKMVATGKKYQCNSCDKWHRKSPALQFLGDKVYVSVKKRGTAAKNRCNNPSNKNYSRYGGRGIKFEFDSIEGYVNHVAPFILHRNLDTEVDRINNNENYAPGNIRVVSKKTNTRNRGCTFLVDGVPFADIAEECGLSNSNRRLYKRAYDRVYDGMCLGKLVNKEYVRRTINDILRNPARVRIRTTGLTPKPMLIDGVRLLDIISDAGYHKNKRVYDAVKRIIYHRRNAGKPDYTVAESIEHAHRYAAKHGIKPDENAREAA